MTQLIDRDIAITVGTLRIASRDEVGLTQPVLRIKFNITKTAARDPNKAQLKIWNLSEDSRSKLQEQDRLPVIIDAGYAGTISQVFSGDMRFNQSVKEGSDWVTTLEAGDGSKKYRSARINESFASGTNVTAALKKAVASLGIGNGNIDKIISAGSRRALKEFTNGTVLSGKSSDVIQSLVKSMGYQWSIQDGQVQILDPEQTTQDEAVLLDAGSGLLGSPAAGEKGKVKARSLLQPDIFPGRKVKIDSLLIDGSFFKTEQVRHTGDTWGTSWFSDMDLKPL